MSYHAKVLIHISLSKIRYQAQLREAEVCYEEAARVRQEMSERASLADRRANALQGEMEEARSLLDSAERGKRQTEAELNEARGAVNEMTSINTRAGAEKRSLEAAVHTMQAEIDDMLHQAKNSEEKAKKAMVDAARLAGWSNYPYINNLYTKDHNSYDTLISLLQMSSAPSRTT